MRYDIYLSLLFFDYTLGDGGFDHDPSVAIFVSGKRGDRWAKVEAALLDFI
jgi:hypothetical protein